MDEKKLRKLQEEALKEIKEGDKPAEREAVKKLGRYLLYGVD